MNCGELFTIGKYGLPVKVLMLNNHGDCMVRNIQDLAYGGGLCWDQEDYLGQFCQCGPRDGFFVYPTD